jgi:hypothetical protein
MSTPLKFRLQENGHTGSRVCDGRGLTVVGVGESRLRWAATVASAAGVANRRRDEKDRPYEGTPDHQSSAGTLGIPSLSLIWSSIVLKL